jgi:hypothetical protein
MKEPTSCSFLAAFTRFAKERLLPILFAVIFTMCGVALAQKDTGSIVGTVKDSSGAVDSDAK